MGTWKLKLASPGCISRIWMIYHREQIKLLSFQVPGTQNVHKPLIFVQTADATIAGKLSSRFTLSKLEPISKLSKFSQILGLSGFGFYFRLGEILWGPAVSFFFWDPAEVLMARCFSHFSYKTISSCHWQWFKVVDLKLHWQYCVICCLAVEYEPPQSHNVIGPLPQMIRVNVKCKWVSCSISDHDQLPKGLPWIPS